MARLLEKAENYSVSKRADEYVYSFFVPGSKVKDVNVAVSQDYTRLFVGGSFVNSYLTKPTSTQNGLTQSYRGMSEVFRHEFILPRDVSKTKPVANLVDGVLLVTVKCAVEKKLQLPEKVANSAI